MNTEKTITKEKEVSLEELNDILGTPSASSIITSSDKKPHTVFTPGTKIENEIINDATKKIDEVLSEEEKIKQEEEKKIKEAEIVSKLKEKDDKGAEIINEVLNTEGVEESEEEKNKKIGRPALSKDLMLNVVNKLIEEKSLIPFDDDKPFDKYSEADLIDLIKENLKAKEEKAWEEVPAKFFDSLPEKIQYAAKYVADGGTNLTGLFRLLAQSEETKAIDITSEEGQEEVARRWLHETQFGTPEEIEAEILGYKDKGELDKKANQFKPKLDAKQEEIVSRNLKQQEAYRKKQEKAAQQYVESVQKTLQTADLAGLKLDKKTQASLYYGLVDNNYPSISGRMTNEFAHLIEKYQMVEPNHGIIAEALWLLRDREGYRKAVKAEAKVEQVTETVRKLKTAESQRTTAAASTEENTDEAKTTGTKLKKPRNVFSRDI